MVIQYSGSKFIFTHVLLDIDVSSFLELYVSRLAGFFTQSDQDQHVLYILQSIILEKTQVPQLLIVAIHIVTCVKLVCSVR